MKISGKDLRIAIKSADLTQEEAAEKVGTTRQTLSKWLNYAELPEDILQKVKPLLASSLLYAQPPADSTTTRDNTVPYYANINASAGLSFLTDNSDISPSSYIKVPGLKVDAYINVFGDSMHPVYTSGQIIGIRKIEKDMVHFGYAYVIEMIDGEAYIKYIQPGKDDDHWSLESENDHYHPTEFHISKIRNVYKIKSVLTRNSI